MSKSILNCPIEFDKSDYLSLLSLSVGWSVCCQNRMGELIGDSGWNVDLMGGRIKFGDQEFSSGLIGTEAAGDSTWLWAWAHTESGLPEIAAAPSRRAKRQLSQCDEFANGKFLLDEIRTGHNLSMICCAASEKNLCYYRCPHSGVSAFVTVEGLPQQVFALIDAQSFLRQYLEIVSTFYCDHRLLAAGFLYMNGTEFTEQGASLIADFAERTLRFDFEPAEGLHRLVNVNFD